MERRGAYGNRRGALGRRRIPPDTSPVSIRRRERAESSSGNEERESENFRDAAAGGEQTGQVKPTVILMKPERSRKNDDVEDEWPAVGKPIKIVPSRTGTPVRRAEPTSSTVVPSPYTAEDDKELGVHSGHGRRRPMPFESGSSTGMWTTGTTGHYQTQHKPHLYTPDIGASSEPGGVSAKTLRGGIRMITEAMEWSETPLDYLQEQSNFLVVGVVGPQGVGKSTLMSMVGGNDSFDMYRQYIFRPASKECTETGSRQTAGVQFFVNEDRVILLDSQPILSHAVMEQMNQSDRRYAYDYRMTENCMEIESLQIASFLMQVCHVIIFLVDWFVDADLIRFIQTAEILKPCLPISENLRSGDHFPHVVFVQNRGRREDFTLLSVKEKCKFVEKLFTKSSLLTKGGISLRHSSYDLYEELGEDLGAVNLFVLPDMKPRGYKPESLTSYKGIPDYEILIRDLRKQILALPRMSFGPSVQTEKNWFHMAARIWDMTRKSLLISEYGRLLP